VGVLTRLDEYISPTPTGMSVPPKEVLVMPDEDLKIKRRNLPHWRVPGAAYFVTFRVASGELTRAERDVVFRHIRSGDGRFYRLLAVVVMPDHVHILLEPLTGYDLSRISKGIKGVSAKLINDLRGSRGSVWQDESWDRIMRDDAELQEKLGYMLNNPVKRELVSDGWDWPWWYAAAEAS
jgi:putative transposase